MASAAGSMAVLLLLALLLLRSALAAFAAQTAAAATARSVVTLVSDVDSIPASGAFRIGLRITPAAGWHVYWRNPGDAGAPPRLELSPVVELGDIAWPLPERIANGPVMSFGYAGSVLLARHVRVAAGTGSVMLRANASWLICATICVPEAASFSLTLPRGAGVASADRAAFDAEATLVPKTSPWPAFIAADGTLWLTGVPAGPAAFIPDSADTTKLAAPQLVHRTGGRLLLHLAPTASFRADQPMTGVLVLGAGSDRVGYTVHAVPAAAPAEAEGIFWAALLLAFCGGALLNLMPCVFPVLAMKAAGIAGLAGQAHGAVRSQALSYVAGVLASFLALALALLALRGAGAAAGWGFQLQWPAFVAALAWLFFAIGLNLSGVFSLRLAVIGAGQSMTRRPGHVGSFATGVLAVLVATPCTAPFMGVALGAAVTASAAGSVGIFLALGLGFALPYLVLAAAPELARALPKPGAWMEWLRQGLAFPMYATAVWLIWVLVREAGPAGVLQVGAGLVLIGAGGWLLRFDGRAVRLAAVACLLGAISILPGIQRAPAAAAAASEAYSAARLTALQAARQPVLVNMTAAWCVTCIVNERLVLEPGLAGLAARHVAYLVGDWSRQDPAITQFLHDHGRDGVPLYVFFAPDHAPRVLPQILTPAVLRSLS